MAAWGDHHDQDDEDDEEDEEDECIKVEVGARWPRPEERETRLHSAPAQHYHRLYSVQHYHRYCHRHFSHRCHRCHDRFLLDTGDHLT